MQTKNNTSNASAAATAQVGNRVRMTSENSNWIIGETGTIVWVGDDRVAIEFDGREDDYTAFMDDLQII